MSRGRRVDRDPQAALSPPLVAFCTLPNASPQAALRLTDSQQSSHLKANAILVAKDTAAVFEAWTRYGGDWQSVRAARRVSCSAQRMTIHAITCGQPAPFLLKQNNGGSHALYGGVDARRSFQRDRVVVCGRPRRVWALR